MPVTERTYEQIALEDPERQWELHRGVLREKPTMTAGHNRMMTRLGFELLRQLDWREFDVRINSGRLRRRGEMSYIPDLAVIPVGFVRPLLDRVDTLESYAEPLPLVVEVWSPSTGEYDVDEKLPEYQARGDLEIWRVHPFERTLTAWRRQADGIYQEHVFRDGIVRPMGLPSVAIDLDTLFA